MDSKKVFDKLLYIVGIFFVFFVITMIGAYFLESFFGLNRNGRNGMLIISVFQALVMFIAPAFISARIISRSPVSYLQLDKPPKLISLLGVIFAYFIALPFLNQIIYWNAHFTPPAFLADWWEIMKDMEEKANIASTTMLDVTSPFAMLINLIVVGFITASGEEIFFRSSLQHTGSFSGYHHLSIWLVAFFFSAMHFQVLGFIPRLLLGAWFGYLLFWTKNSYIPIFAHFVNNGMVVICVWLSSIGIAFDFENFGVVSDGFPLPALVSVLAFAIFIIFFRKVFFHPIKRNRENSIQQFDYA